MQTVARTKYAQVHKLIRERILNGTYPPGSRIPTETELPAQLNVSAITVIRALNDLAREGLIVRRRRSGSYVTDPAQKPLMPGRNVRIAVLFPHSVLRNWQHLSTFHGSVLRGLLKGLGVDVPATYSDVAEDEATRAVMKAPLRGITVEILGEELSTRRMHPPIEAVREGAFDGVVSLGIVEEPFIRELQTLSVPSVLVDFLNNRLRLNSDQVYFDPMPGYIDAVAHLAARGARRIHFLGNLLRRPSESVQEYSFDPDRLQPQRGRFDPDSMLRLSACRQALTELGLPSNDRWVHFNWFRPDQVRAKAAELAALPAEERPDAMVCHSAEQAQWCIDVFAEKGLRLAGTGATEPGFLGHALPIFANSMAMGQSAASLLVWRLQQPDRSPLCVGVPMQFPMASERSNGSSATLEEKR